MTDFNYDYHGSIPSPLDIDTSFQLVSRLELWPKLLRRYEEEYIASLVPVDPGYISKMKNQLLENYSLPDYLSKHMLSESDLDTNLHLVYGLEQFSNERFGPGLEEEFLSAQGGHDEVIYSVIRLEDVGLAQELWIRLEEGEATFPQLAEMYGQSPEAERKGLFGPLPIGNIQPLDLAKLLRTLKPGEVHPPVTWGQWHLLIRLERLQPARFDHSLRKHLLTRKLDSFLDNRVGQRLSGQEPESLVFHPS